MFCHRACHLRTCFSEVSPEAPRDAPCPRPSLFSSCSPSMLLATGTFLSSQHTAGRLPPQSLAKQHLLRGAAFPPTSQPTTPSKTSLFPTCSPSVVSWPPVPILESSCSGTSCLPPQDSVCSFIIVLLLFHALPVTSAPQRHHCLPSADVRTTEALGVLFTGTCPTCLI